MPIALILADAGPLDPGAQARLRADLQRLSEALSARFPVGGEVRARIVGDDAMAALHARHSGVEGTTDVLTFDLRDEPGAALDTDVVTCLDVAAREGAERGHPPERELLLYILHGALHCLGFDDHTDEGFAAMHAAEDELLAAAGVGPLFSPPDPRNAAP
ncbi:MAG: rRNA maturation RNase YbeY [Phycisphaerales bacterium]|nr:rRNA maturation RNase YbeY [Phycisphaerales bacterium]